MFCDELLGRIDRQFTRGKYGMSAIGANDGAIFVKKPLAILGDRQIGNFLERQETGQIQLNGTVGNGIAAVRAYSEIASGILAVPKVDQIRKMETAKLTVDAAESPVRPRRVRRNDMVRPPMHQLV